MTVLAIYADHNTGGRVDSTGAFEPEAKAFARLHGGIAVPFDNRPKWKAGRGRRRVEVERLIWESSSELYDAIAIFSHGLKTSLQTGHDLETVGGLAHVIGRKCVPGAPVILYACDAARDADRDKADDHVEGPAGDGGFADALRDAMLDLNYRGFAVFAHVTTGHTTQNPYVRAFHGDPEARAYGGDWLVAPGSPLWRRWRLALKGDAEPADLRLRFPFMTVAELHTALGDRAAA